MASMNDFIKHPKGSMALAEEMKKAIDAYWNRELSEMDLKELMWAWAGTGKLLKEDDYNSSIKKLCGKARMEVVDRLLQGYQRSLLKR